jgi:hypothetical protein
MLYETSRECACLRRMVNPIKISHGNDVIESPTIIYEDNVACVAEMQI